MFKTHMYQVVSHAFQRIKGTSIIYSMQIYNIYEKINLYN